MIPFLINAAVALVAITLVSVICIVFMRDKVPPAERSSDRTVAGFTPVVACCGTEHETDVSFEYLGDMTCASAVLVYGGEKSCIYACIGYGDCEKVCPQNAIKLSDGIPVIDRTKCNFCKKCIEACPKGLIRPQNSYLPYYVACSNRKMGKTEKFCKNGCIGCGKCIEVCEPKAIKYNGKRIVIDNLTCTKCGACEEVCDRGVIRRI